MAYSPGLVLTVCLNMYMAVDIPYKYDKTRPSGISFSYCILMRNEYTNNNQSIDKIILLYSN